MGIKKFHKKEQILETKVLIIDDDTKLQNLLTEYLQSYGYKIINLMSGSAVSETIQKAHPKIVILDVVLPDTDGFEILREIKKSHDIPVIMLSAKGEDTDRIVGLEMGADDYLAKPFNPRELLARMKAVLRRPAVNGTRDNIKESTEPKEREKDLQVGDIILDRSRQVVSKGDKKTDLTLTEYRILEALMTTPNTVFSRDELMNQARGNDIDVFDRSIDMHVSKIRAKIESISGSRSRIKTVWSTGYMFVDE